MDVQEHTHSTLRRLARLSWYLAAQAALVLLFASLPSYLAGFPFALESGAGTAPVTDSIAKLLAALASLGGAVLCLCLAALLFFRRADDNMALFVSFYLLGFGVLMAGPLEAAIAGRGIDVSAAYSAQTAVLTLPTVILLFTFPTGRFVPRWTWGLIMLSVPVALLALRVPGVEWATFGSTLVRLLGVAVGALLTSGIVAQIYRYRRVSGSIERQQAKWVVGGLVLWFIYNMLSAIPWIVLNNLPVGAPLPWWQPIMGVTWWLALSILPVSLTIAIMRNRLFAIDIIIRRTLVYGVLTATLALIYFGTVVLLQAAFGAVSGQQSPLAIVVSTLLIARLFTPMRRRIQSGIDRRFFRIHYNSAQVLAEFARQSRDEVDLEGLSNALLQAVDLTMQPESLSLWVRQDRP